MPNPPIANVPGAPGYKPPGIWGGGNEPFPTPPIVIPLPPDSDFKPEHPIVIPPGIWGGANEPFPSHPIVIVPPPPTDASEGGGKPPPSDGGWGYHPEFGWGYFPGTGGTPGPKA